MRHPKPASPLFLNNTIIPKSLAMSCNNQTGCGKIMNQLRITDPVGQPMVFVFITNQASVKQPTLQFDNYFSA